MKNIYLLLVHRGNKDQMRGDCEGGYISLSIFWILAVQRFHCVFFIELHLQVSWEGCKSMLNFYYNRQQHTNTSIRWKLCTQEKKAIQKHTSRKIFTGEENKKTRIATKKHCLKYQLLRHGHYAACSFTICHCVKYVNRVALTAMQSMKWVAEGVGTGI